MAPETIALEGGPKTCPEGTIPAWPQFDAGEEEALLRVLRSRKWWRVPGSEVDQFEQAFAQFHDVKFGLGVTNGTQAIELSLACLGVGFGDEVIVPAFTFASTATAVICAGATPVAIDVDLDTYCMSTAALEAAVTARTKAIIPVHLAGHCCDMDSIRAISAKHGLRIISDAAHAHGARWRETSLARLCDIAIYSFQSGKLLTAGEGGMLLTESPAIAELAFLKSSCGRGRRDRVYDHCVLGTNMRMSEFHGAILEAQLKRFPAQLREREEAAVRLDRALEGMPGLQAQGRLPGVTTHSHYMYMVRLDEAVAGIGRDRLVDALVAEGVPAFRSYRAIPDLEMFREGRLWAGAPPETLRPRQVQEALHRHDTRNARLLGETSLWLHHAVLLGSPEVQRSVARAFAKVLAWEGQRKTVRQGVTSDVARPHA